MALDTASLLLLNLLVTCALALCLFVVADASLPDGLSLWALALISFAGVPLLYSLQDHVADWHVVAMPNFFMSAAFAFNIQGLLVLDIDHFKRINDQHGHLSGDQVLHHFAQCLERHLRTQDIAGRWGGEEFIVLLPHTGTAGALVVAERLRSAVQTHAFFNLQQQRLSVTTSIGLHEVLLDCPQAPAALLDAADRALYQAKKNGRNCVVVSTAAA